MAERNVWGWAPYREGGPWHAVRDRCATWCGLMDTALDVPTSDPHGRRCVNCLGALERGTPYRRHGQPGRRTTPRTTARHRDGDLCACPDCRDHRRSHAREYAASVLDVLPGCECVRRWERVGDYTGEAAARWAALLLAWEVTGERTTARDVEEAARILHRAWREAADAYELLDGSHPHRQRGRR